ncbi:hypothetical protein C1646_674865 [Rhizophagus diaphanus]|nr:hypothetical protein C1646_674865 [Rhizophagus diaphanus] [Rhizophagus sp. MUCL 43196]
MEKQQEDMLFYNKSLVVLIDMKNNKKSDPQLNTESHSKFQNFSFETIKKNVNKHFFILFYYRESDPQLDTKFHRNQDTKSHRHRTNRTSWKVHQFQSLDLDFGSLMALSAIGSDL